MAKSPRIVPGAEARGFVAPSRAVLISFWLMDLVGEILDVLRPVLTASRPSQTMAQMGPLNMSMEKVRQLPVYLHTIGRNAEVAAYR